jgi:hypothetical protein
MTDHRTPPSAINTTIKRQLLAGAQYIYEVWAEQRHQDALRRWGDKAQRTPWATLTDEQQAAWFAAFTAGASLVAKDQRKQCARELEQALEDPGGWEQRMRYLIERWSQP